MRSTEDQSDPESDTEDAEACSMTYSDVQSMLKKLKTFAVQKDVRFLEPVQGLIQITDQSIVRLHSEKKQTTLDSFFKPE